MVARYSGHPNIEPYIIADRELLVPKGQRFITENIEFPVGKDGFRRPHFTGAQVAKCFFGRDPQWMQYVVRRSKANPETLCRLDGEQLVVDRLPRGDRYFTLLDIEKLAHGLVQQNRLTPKELQLTLGIVKNVAMLSGLL